MDGVVMDPRLKTLMVKFQQGIQRHPEVIQELQKAGGQGPLPYDKRLGLTQGEYSELLALMNKREMRSVSTGSADVSVTNEKGIIRFAAQGKLAILNDIWLDLPHNEVHAGSRTLPFIEAVNVTDAQNAFGSAWFGYKWELAEPKDLDISKYDMRDLSNLNASMYKVVVGKIATTGQTLVQIKGMEIKNGVRTVSYEIPLFFQ
ncbi:hypothetical protein ASU33_00135 [Solirubrum puertoriconensis]|uniref:Uncharacterized protein n=2 Tax=Solirubrum puertoriconensis TaxID=1751427 RepID=A0A9X0HH75_SOLP1|nr:hypothetical protein ASU33_00135 [Solirubrum puertoriconensis]